MPNISPEINLSFHEAVNLLINSIVMEEISLSKLMDAETDYIKYVLEKQKCNTGDMEDIISANNSVNAVLANKDQIRDAAAVEAGICRMFLHSGITIKHSGF